jgi:hypothetical protein
MISLPAKLKGVFNHAFLHGTTFDYPAGWHDFANNGSMATSWIK